MKAIFTADLHGNILQFERLFQYAEEHEISTVILGGDIAPKGRDGSIVLQKRVMSRQLIPLIKKYTHKISRHVLLMLGNDDWASCLAELKPYDGKLLHLIHMKKISIKQVDFVGYSCVPITPFGIKDWEKWDTEYQSTEYIRLDGLKSIGNEMTAFAFNPDDKSDTIENDLKKLAKLSDPASSIYVFHAPPYNTKLDMISPAIHIGSSAIRTFIEEHQPLLTLHGHIHESVDVSGAFVDTIHKTVCVSVGNYHDRKELAVIIFDTNDLTKIKREIIS